MGLFHRIKRWMAKANKKKHEPINGIDLEALWRRSQRAGDGYGSGVTDYLRDRRETDADEIRGSLDEEAVDARIKHNSTLPMKMPVFTGNMPKPLTLVKRHHGS